MKIPILMLTAFAVAVSSCRSGPVESTDLDSFPVRVEVVSRGSIEETLTLVGSVKARDEATLYSRVPGKLQANLLKEGDRVDKDQAVALVLRDEVGVRFEPAPVPSTLTGVVGRLFLDRGANVTLNTPVALVLDDRELLVKADVPERYVGRLAIDQPVRISVEAFPDAAFGGRVSRISPAVDPNTRTSPIEMRLSNGRDRVRSGMFAKCQLVVARRDGVLRVRPEALGDSADPFVFVAVDGKAVRRAVETGLRTDEAVELRSGVREGENVIVSGLFGLQDGSPIEVASDENR